MILGRSRSVRSAIVPLGSLGKEVSGVIIKGSVSCSRVKYLPPIDPPKACRFANRCTHCTPKCQDEHPDLMEYQGHKVRCWLFEGGKQEEVKHVEE